MSLVLVLLSLCVGKLFPATKRSALYRIFFNAIPHSYLSVLEQLKLVYFALRSPVMITLFAKSSTNRFQPFGGCSEVDSAACS